MRAYILIAILCLSISPLLAQRGDTVGREIQQSESSLQQNAIQTTIDRIAGGASNRLNIDMDAALLASAAKSVSVIEEMEGNVRKLLSGLKAINVRMFDLAAAGESRAKLQPLRDLLKSPQWFRSVSLASADEELEIWSGRDGDKPTGVVLISVSGKRIFIMNVAGDIRPDQLRYLSGRLGVPNINGKLEIPIDASRPQNQLPTPRTPSQAQPTPFPPTAAPPASR